jgi:hypothetical protein
LQLSTLNLNIKEMPIEINLGHRFKFRDIAKILLDIIFISYKYRIRQWYQNNYYYHKKQKDGLIIIIIEARCR